MSEERDMEFGGVRVDYAHTLWFVAAPDEDWLAMIFKTKNDPGWNLMYRFRYCNSTDPWDDADTKNWYRMQFPEEAIDKVVERTKFIAALTAVKLAKQYGVDPTFDELTIMGSGGDALAAMMARPWCHHRTGPPPEEEADA